MIVVLNVQDPSEMKARKEFYREMEGGLDPTFYDEPFYYHSDTSYNLAWVSKTYLYRNQQLVENDPKFKDYI
jgi:hypothetical protein